MPGGQTLGRNRMKGRKDGPVSPGGSSVFRKMTGQVCQSLNCHSNGTSAPMRNHTDPSPQGEMLGTGANRREVAMSV